MPFLRFLRCPDRDRRTRITNLVGYRLLTSPSFKMLVNSVSFECGGRPTLHCSARQSRSPPVTFGMMTFRTGNTAATTDVALGPSTIPRRPSFEGLCPTFNSGPLVGPVLFRHEVHLSTTNSIVPGRVPCVKRALVFLPASVYGLEALRS